MSPTCTSKARVAVSEMTWRLKCCAPSFSYQATRLSRQEEDRTSVSPSPSRSAAKTAVGSLTSVVMVCSVNDSEPLFSYQEMRLLMRTAATTSMSPSPSTSAASTAWAALTPVATASSPEKPSVVRGLGRMVTA